MTILLSISFHLCFSSFTAVVGTWKCKFLFGFHSAKVENIVQNILGRSGTRNTRTVSSKSNSLCTHNNIIGEVVLSFEA
jgi:hypothetical protein